MTTPINRQSFVKGARGSQRDWGFTEQVGDSTIIGFGDGHGSWTPETHAAYFNQQLSTALRANAGYSPCERLTIAYRTAVIATQQRFRFAEIGSAGIWFLVTPDETVWLVRGDCEAACMLPDGTRWNTPVFDWDSDFGKLLAAEFASALGLQYTGNIPRTDAFAWEHRLHPTFNHVQDMQLPETIGVMTCREFEDLARYKTPSQCDRALSLLCGSCDDLEFAARAETLFLGSPAGFKVLAASDGIRSKAALGLDGAINNVAHILWDADDISAVDVIRSNTDGYWGHSFGPSGSNQTHVLRQLQGPSDAPQCMMRSLETFDALLSTPDAMTRFQSAMLLWKNAGSLDRMWWEAIDEAVTYLCMYPTRDSAPNALDWANRIAVACMSDDNTSSSEWCFAEASPTGSPVVSCLGATRELQLAALQQELILGVSATTED